MADYFPNLDILSKSPPVFLGPGAAVFPGAGFPGASLPGAGFPGASLPGAGLPGAGFPGASLPGAGFPGASLAPNLPTDLGPAAEIGNSERKRLITM